MAFAVLTNALQGAAMLQICGSKAASTVMLLKLEKRMCT
jgi:hypothetical protein